MQSRGTAVDQAVLTDSALDINLTNPVSRPGRYGGGGYGGVVWEISLLDVRLL